MLAADAGRSGCRGKLRRGPHPQCVEAGLATGRHPMMAGPGGGLGMV